MNPRQNVDVLERLALRESELSLLDYFVPFLLVERRQVDLVLVLFVIVQMVFAQQYVHPGDRKPRNSQAIVYSP